MLNIGLDSSGNFGVYAGAVNVWTSSIFQPPIRGKLDGASRLSGSSAPFTADAGVNHAGDPLLLFASPDGHSSSLLDLGIWARSTLHSNEEWFLVGSGVFDERGSAMIELDHLPPGVEPGFGFLTAAR